MTRPHMRNSCNSAANAKLTLRNADQAQTPGHSDHEHAPSRGRQLTCLLALWCTRSVYSLKRNTRKAG